MGPRLRTSRAAQRLSAGLTPLAVLGCAAVLFLSDWGYQHGGGTSLPAAAVLDETAHVLTALLLLQGLSARLRARFALPALFASVAIDLDHVPQDLGYHFLTVGTPRPYTHSLLTIAVLLALAVALRRRRDLLLGLALGLVLHFFRDLAEGNGSGVALLWPLTDRGYSYPHATYLAVMACVVAADVTLGLLSRRARAATS
ncbi:MAG TPA: metal-dependent hydrolase [Solirubrobacteraceae bacterium]|nr:metal-dependent hydrolase [Solirubrobacteraceae bacterium]